MNGRRMFNTLKGYIFLIFLLAAIGYKQPELGNILGKEKD